MVGWSSEEDELLRRAVAIHGETDHWKTIALSVPGRSNKACRKRWLHSLSPRVKKSAWTAAEDRRLLDLYASCGPKWSQIARQIPGRTDDACSKRYREALDPKLKKDEWSSEEDERLRQAYARLGGKWGNIGQELNRSGLGCRNRWRLLERRSSKLQPSLAPDPVVYDPCALLGVQDSPSNHFSLPYFPPDAYPVPQSPTSLTNLTNDANDSTLDSQRILAPIPYSSFSSLSHALGPSGSSSEFSSPSELSETDRLPASLPMFNTILESGFEDDDCLSSVQDGYIWDTLGPVCMPPFSPYESVPNLTVCESPASSVALITPPQRELFPPLPEGGLDPNFQSSPIPLPLNTLPLLSDPTIIPSHSNIVPEVHTAAAADSVSQDDASVPVSGLGELPVRAVVDRRLCEPAVPSASAAPELESANNTHNTRSKHRRKSNLLRKSSNSPGFCRLSSQLTVTSDPSVLPYACGHTRCWPPDAPVGLACFATSKELSEHVKAQHHQDNACQRPFKCALDGCGKLWKSVNGLQYHLQISAAHFRTAVNEKLSESRPPSDNVDSNGDTDCDSTSSAKSKSKFFACSRSGCAKVYRQVSGLRYHERHGHPEDIPAQLKDMPPILADRVANKSTSGRKRRKVSVAQSLGHKVARS